VGKGRIHVSLDETLLLALRERADREHCNQSDVIAAALHRELSPELFDRKWKHRLSTDDEANSDGDGDGHSTPAGAHRHEPAAAGHPHGG
jgi:hypothetical protein